MNRVAIVWPGFTGYMGDCWRELAARHDVKVWIEPSRYEQRFDGSELAGIDWRRVERGGEGDAVGEMKAFASDAMLVCGWSTPLAIAAGAAEFDQKYDKQVSKLAECSNIIWLDKSLPKSRILELYTESDVFYFPSYMEGSPLVVLDAVANGCIPVVSYAGSLNEIVENGVNGFISHFDDFDAQYSAIMELSRNRELFWRIKENVLKTRLPSWEDTADMLMKIYSEGQKK